MIKLGDKVEDTMSGFKGTAFLNTVFLNGCRRFCVVSDKLKDNATHEEWIDEIRLDPKAKKVDPLPYPLGLKVKDEITGFAGIATSMMNVLNGNIRIGITSRTKTDKDNTPVELWFDAHRLGAKMSKRIFGGVSEKEKPPGGPTSTPKQYVPPSRFRQ